MQRDAFTFGNAFVAKEDAVLGEGVLPPEVEAEGETHSGFETVIVKVLGFFVEGSD